MQHKYRRSSARGLLFDNWLATLPEPTRLAIEKAELRYATDEARKVRSDSVEREFAESLQGYSDADEE